MISYLLTGAACAVIGMASGQGLVLSLGRRRLARRLAETEQHQTALYKRITALEADRAEWEEGRNRLSERLQGLEAALPSLISRAEVERAFAQAAQIEAQRQLAIQQAQRQAAPFRPAVAAGGAAELNTAINGQLQALEERIARINQEFGLG